MNDQQRVQELDTVFSHIWMVRTFIKHSEEAEEDDELRDVHRALYDVMHALGAPLENGNFEKYLKLARKKLKRLREARDLFLEIQPEISEHTNFKMAARSLEACVRQVESLLVDPPV